MKPSLRIYDNGVTRCQAYNDKILQKACPDYLKSTFENRCMFLMPGNMCDWHPDYAVFNKTEPEPEPSDEEPKGRWVGWGMWEEEPCSKNT